MPKPDWKDFEKALGRIVHDLGYALDRNGESGDLIARFMLSPKGDGDDFNLTELARDLEDRL